MKKEIDIMDKAHEKIEENVKKKEKSAKVIFQLKVFKVMFQRKIFQTRSYCSLI